MNVYMFCGFFVKIIDYASSQINILTQSIAHVYNTMEKKISSTFKEIPSMKQINVRKIREQ